MVTGRTFRTCSVCGVRLAGDNRENRCGPCSVSRSQDLSQRPPAVPPGFWDDGALRRAFASRHFGRVIRAYRHHPRHGRPLSQERVARWLLLSQAQLSRIECGAAVQDLSRLTAWARILGVPPRCLWFTLPEETGAPLSLSAGKSLTQQFFAHAIVRPGRSAVGGYADHDRRYDPEADDMRRRELLRPLAIGGAVDGVDFERIEASRRRGVDRATLDQYEALNAELWRVFVLASAKVRVAPLVQDHLALILDVLQRSVAPDLRRRLSALVADLLQLSGEIAFDHNAYTDAVHCYTLAGTAAREAKAADLWACALVRNAFVALAERNHTAAAHMLELAADIAADGDSELSTRQWVAAVRAETFAGAGNTAGRERALERAEQVIGLPGPVHNGGWLRFDASRLPEERATCYLELGRFDLAEKALAEVPPDGLSVRRRGGVLVDMAALGARRRDIDRLLAYGADAVELARTSASGYLGRKLHGLGRQLGPLLGDRRVAALAADIAELNAA